jgi:hypothetical protein
VPNARNHRQILDAGGGARQPPASSLGTAAAAESQAELSTRLRMLATQNAGVP